MICECYRKESAPEGCFFSNPIVSLVTLLGATCCCGLHLYLPHFSLVHKGIILIFAVSLTGLCLLSLIVSIFERCQQGKELPGSLLSESLEINKKKEEESVGSLLEDKSTPPIMQTLEKGRPKEALLLISTNSQLSSMASSIAEGMKNHNVEILHALPAFEKVAQTVLPIFLYMGIGLDDAHSQLFIKLQGKAIRFVLLDFSPTSLSSIHLPECHFKFPYNSTIFNKPSYQKTTAEAICDILHTTGL